MCAYQSAVRPAQIGMLRMRDVRVWPEAADPQPAVHLTFKMIKQRRGHKNLPMVRRVKREWACLFVELYRRRQRTGAIGSERLFGVASARKISHIIVRRTGELLPKPRSAVELRHSAAQRLVDAGASHEELASFMGQRSLESGLVYYEDSPNQAESVNAALGISEVYSNVIRIARNKFISRDDLARLKGEQQIAGVPHGIPIAGIGGCAVGQPACPYNPVTACYGCPKFMPSNDLEIHKQVLSDFRSIVTFFEKTSRGDTSSPTYMQLKRTIAIVQSIIAELEGVRV